MTEFHITSVLLPQETINQGGLYIAKGIAEKTVWDKHATENPEHAAISAPNEEAARRKSVDQIALISQHVTPETILLDVGAGYGRVAQYLLPQQTIRGYIGVDSSYEMLSLFHDRYVRSDEEQRTPLLLINADIHTLPLKSASVTLAVVCAVFLHNHKDVVRQAVLELKRVLAPEGKLLVYSSFPRKATVMGVQGTLYQMILNLLGKPFKNGPVRYYSKGEVARLFVDFSDIDIIPTGFAVLPKTLIFLPGILEVGYRKLIANPINTILARVLPLSFQSYFATHYDVVVTR